MAIATKQKVETQKVTTEKKATEKVTFALPAEMVREMRAVVEKGEVGSQNALVREALQHELKRRRRVEFEREMEAAARDPLFMQDLEAMDARFSSRGHGNGAHDRC